jgi:two-component system phosphate regulon response regulator PhoB
MPEPLVIIVEDDPDIGELISFHVAREGFKTRLIPSGRTAIDEIGRREPRIVILDLMLPDLDGLEICRRLKWRDETRSIPILIVSAKGEESDIVAGLELGADDYVTKPFSPKVLIARLQAVLRRRSAAGEEGDEDKGAKTIAVHDLVVNPRRHEVLRQGKPVELTRTEFRVLHLLARNPGWVFTRQQILDGVHGQNYAITERAVDVQIVGLRKKLGTAGKHIDTVRGVGYRFKE